MATALPTEPCTPQFLSFTQEIDRKIQPSHIRNSYTLPLPDFCLWNVILKYRCTVLHFTDGKVEHETVEMSCEKSGN